jgi:hypothetical protein
MKQIIDHDFFVGDHDIDMSSTDRNYLIRCKLAIDERLASIKQKVNDAKRTFAAGGRASDRDWLTRAETAIRVTGKASQVLQARLAELKDQRRTEAVGAAARAMAVKNSPANLAAKLDHQTAWCQAFVDAARATLDAETFGDLARKAHSAVGPKLLPEVHRG